MSTEGARHSRFMLGSCDMHASSLDYHAFNVRAARSDDFRYPYPFNDDFFHFLQNYSGADSAETARILSDYSSNQVVVFIRVHHAPSTLVLNQLAAWVVANAILSGIARLDGMATVKTNGNLGIFLAATPARAVDFALDARTALAEGGHQCNIGIAAGEALVFPATGSGCADIG